MNLFIKDRLYLISILPEQGNFREYNAKKSILEKVIITDEEKKLVGLTEDTEKHQINWDPAKDSALVVDFSKDECEYLKNACEAASENRYADDVWEVIGKVYDYAVAELAPKTPKKK